MRGDLKAALERHETEVGVLEREVADLQNERTELKKKMDVLGRGKGISRTPGAVSDASSADVKAARTQVQVLEHTLSSVRMELAQLRGAQKRAELRTLPRLVFNAKPADSEAAATSCKEAAAFLNEALVGLASKKVISLARPKAPAPKAAPAPAAADAAGAADPEAAGPPLTVTTYTVWPERKKKLFLNCLLLSFVSSFSRRWRSWRGAWPATATCSAAARICWPTCGPRSLASAPTPRPPPTLASSPPTTMPRCCRRHASCR